ncbi:MAG: cell division protein FtsL [Desulfobacterales bacterium]|nr:cell division protein FtsL [Desulfobacterales bacterium]
MKKNIKNKKTGLRRTGLWTIIMVLFISELFIYTWCRVQCVKTGYEISKETDKNLKLTALQKNLKIEIARLKSPKRIAKIATQQLGLIMPKPGQVIIIP